MLKDILTAICLAVLSAACYAEINVKDFGAKGDGRPDDTEAIQKAFDEAVKVGAPEVIFPAGDYRISKPIVVRVSARGPATIWQSNPEEDVFYSEWAQQISFSDLVFRGGHTPLNLGNPNTDTGFIQVVNCKFFVSTGPAIQVRKGSNSTFTIVQNCQFINCDQVLISYTDWTLMKACWISGGAKQENEAMIENRGAKMTLENIVGVPNPNGPDQRWIDNYGMLACKDFRFGGEGGGFTPVVNFAKYAPQLGGPTIIIEDSWVSAIGNYKRNCAVFLEEVPNLVEIRNCNLAGAVPVIVSEKIDPKTYFEAKPGMLKFVFENNVGEFAGPRFQRC